MTTNTYITVNPNTFGSLHIKERADTEWKFARSKLWISYFEEGGTVRIKNFINSVLQLSFLCNDFLFCEGSTPIQHHSYTKKRLVYYKVDVPTVCRRITYSKERAYEDYPSKN